MIRRCSSLLAFLPLLAALSLAVLAAPADGPAPPAARFRAVDIDTQVEIGYGVAVADVDGDGRTDILLADKHLIVWYRNPTWEKHIMVEKLTPLDHVCLAAADINGDGKAEVAAGAGWNPGDTLTSGSVHYLMAPAERTGRWAAVPLPHEPTVHRMRWVRDQSGQHHLVVVPLHGRGNKGGQGEGVRILCYHKPDDPRTPWTTELIDDTLHMTHNFEVVQWDEDAAQELLVAAREGVFLFDRGPGKESSKWRRTQLAGGAALPGAGEIRHGRLPGGQRFLATVEPMHGNSVAIYTAPATAEKGVWRRQVIDDTLREGHAVGCGDVLGVGYDQVVVGWRGKNSDGKVGIRLYTPLDGTGRQWRQSTIDDNAMACEDLTLADLNGDGKLDIIASGRATRNLKVYFGEP
jgi:FG-GAP-like repeat